MWAVVGVDGVLVDGRRPGCDELTTLGRGSVDPGVSEEGRGERGGCDEPERYSGGRRGAVWGFTGGVRERESGRGWASAGRASAAGRTVYPGVRVASGTEEEEESCR